MYSIVFADYAYPSSGALQPLTVRGKEALRNFFTKIGLNQKIEATVFQNISTEGQTSILRVVLPDEMLKELGLQAPRTQKDKTEAAIRMLREQGHLVEPIIRDNGRMWFQIDRKMLASWDEMVNLADGVYTLDALVQIYKLRQKKEAEIFPVRFTVFFEPGGPILAHSFARVYEPTSFASTAGTKYLDVNALIRALNRAGLPGREIVEMRQPTRVFNISGAALAELLGRLPEEL